MVAAPQTQSVASFSTVAIPEPVATHGLTNTTPMAFCCLTILPVYVEHDLHLESGEPFGSQSGGQPFLRGDPFQSLTNASLTTVATLRTKDRNRMMDEGRQTGSRTERNINNVLTLHVR